MKTPYLKYTLFIAVVVYLYWQAAVGILSV